MGSTFLITLSLLCLPHTGGTAISDEGWMDNSETDYSSILCPAAPPLTASSQSVHTLLPGDVSSVYALGAPASLRPEAARVVTRVTELLSMFSANVQAPNIEDSAQGRTILEEIVAISQHPSQESQWKILLLLVPVNSLCPCSAHATAEVPAEVQTVADALLLVQNKLPRSLVHVVVWSSPHQLDSSCECVGNEKINQRLLHATHLKTLQDSLETLVGEERWLSDQFSVVLQPVPLITQSVSSVSEVSAEALQLWSHMLQAPSNPRSEVTAGLPHVPCPTRERPFLRTQKNSAPDAEQRGNTPAAVDPVLGTELPCTDRRPSVSTPTSVHSVRPADIRVVAAVGDSLTAANGVGAKTDNILLVANEYRGLSWCIGGDANLTTVTTLPNILKEFNPNVTGFSLGQGGENQPNAFLNQAVPGAKSRDMVAQVQKVVNILKTDERIDFYSDWKLITVFVAGNDICDFCTDSVVFSARNVVENIRLALDVLHREVPRAVVNLVELFHITPLRELHQDSSLGCPSWFVRLVCPCVLKPNDGSAELERLEQFNREYQKAMRELVESGRYDTHENFTVVLQPFFREIFLPKLEDGRPDRSWFSPDCFHLSQKAHTLMARALWNNMLEPVGNKTYTQDFTQGIELLCPSETRPFIRTAANSNYTFAGPPPTPPPITNWGSDFSCADTAPSQSVPTSVHRLRPADIKVIGALGDSLTTAFGAKAKNLLQLRTEYKGVSWSIGGDKTLESVTTLPNILKKFNPDLKGFSLGTGSAQSKFNMAVSGAKVAGIPGQVRRLIDAMKSDPSVDFEKDWKLVTLFIGGNDLCGYCNDRATLSAANYSLHMRTSLDLLYNEVPRILVNVLEILQIERLRKVMDDRLGCTLLQQFVCTCVVAPSEHSPELRELQRHNQQLQIETEKLVYSGRYDNKEDFAVVVQPYFKQSELPLNKNGFPDTTYFSEDCFHFAERGHSNMASALWNNMLEPVGQKQTYNHFSDARNDIKCPTKEHPYIFTRQNSLPPESTPTPPPLRPSPSGPSGSPAGPPECPDSAVPVWLSPVLGVAGLLLGCGLTWLFMRLRTKNKKKTALEMNGTAF